MNAMHMLEVCCVSCGRRHVHALRAKSCLSVRTQPLTATGAPSQTSTIPYYTIPYHTDLAGKLFFFEPFEIIIFSVEAGLLLILCQACFPLHGRRIRCERLSGISVLFLHIRPPPSPIGCITCLQRQGDEATHALT